MLHDIGKLALLKVIEDIFRNKEAKYVFSEALTIEILDRMHEEVGYRLMKSWNLPEAYSSIAVNHHKDEINGNDILLILVRLADKACKKAGKSLCPDPTISLVSLPEVYFLGIKEMALAELEIMIEDIEELQM